jgi:ABC-type Na+ efflux pump permease subunit
MDRTMGRMIMYAQWIPLIGIIISAIVAMSDDLRIYSVIVNHFHLSAIFHAACVSIVLLTAVITNT